MLRLSTDPGYFTIQTTQIKTRIVYTPGVGYKPENEKNVFQDLVEFTNSRILKSYESQEGSDFTFIFGKATDERVGSYRSMDSLEISPNNN